jgi:hypothetical protein
LELASPELSYGSCGEGEQAGSDDDGPRDDCKGSRVGNDDDGPGDDCRGSSEGIDVDGPGSRWSLRDPSFSGIMMM